MKIYLMRHAHSEEGDRMDAERGITAKGRRQCEDIVAFFDQIDVAFDLVFSSAFERASQTAEYFVDGMNEAPVYLTTLEPDGNPEDAWEAIRARVKNRVDFDPAGVDHVLIVTHDPLIQPMLAAVCFGFAAEHNLFDHANVVHLDDGVFKWWMTPKLARKLVLEESEREVAEAGVELAEHLLHRSVRKVVDPLIEQLRKRITQRFRQQLTPGSRFALIGAVPLKDFDKIAKRAYIAGAMQAESQLGRIQEAKSPKWLTLLPGMQRLSAAVESDIDWTTNERLGALVQELKDQGATEAEVLKALKRQFRDWANGEEGKVSRAEAIAATEISTAYHHGMRDAALLVHRGGNGPVEKSWDAQPDACPTCEANSQDGWIDAEAPFDSGHFEPPAHPNCRCSLSYRVIE